MYLRELLVSERRSTDPPIAYHSTLEITVTETTANAGPTATVPFHRTHHRQQWHLQALKYLHGYRFQDTLLLNMVQLLVSGGQDLSGAQEATPEDRIMQEDLIWVLDQPIVEEAAVLVAVAEEEEGEEEVEDVEVFSMVRTSLSQEQAPILEKRLAPYQKRLLRMTKNQSLRQEVSSSVGRTR